MKKEAFLTGKAFFIINNVLVIIFFFTKFVLLL